MTPTFEEKLSLIFTGTISEKKDDNKKDDKKKEQNKYHSAVGIVQCGDKFLLGLAQKTGDDRSGHWVMPGGHIKQGETPAKAVVREVFEETGIKCTSQGQPLVYPKKKNVAFIHCKAAKGQDLNNNHEFAALGMFTVKEMRSLKLYHNVLELINKVT